MLALSTYLRTTQNHKTEYGKNVTPVVWPPVPK